MKPKLIPYGPIFFDYRDNMSRICKEHMIKISRGFYRQDIQMTSFQCPEGHEITIGRNVEDIVELLLLRIDSKKYQEAEYFDIDGYLVPASKEVQSKNKESDYFVTAQIKHSEKRGDQLVVYAGKKGLKSKIERSQIFIDPEHRKMTFDQNDANPNDVFVMLEATFRDGSKTTILGAETDGEKS